eukprot:347918-Chlamydomonas_euryale.AAC.1
MIGIAVSGWSRAFTEQSCLALMRTLRVRDSHRLPAPLQVAWCFKSITLSYNSSVQTVTAMRNFFANNYVFYDMAKDPLATPQTVNDVIPINQYTPKTDLGAKLDALMDSWPEGQ